MLCLGGQSYQQPSFCKIFICVRRCNNTSAHAKEYWNKISEIFYNKKYQHRPFLLTKHEYRLKKKIQYNTDKKNIHLINLVLFNFLSKYNIF